MSQSLAANIVLGDIFLHPRQRQGAGRLCHRPHIFEQILHRRANSVAVDGDDVVQILLAQTEGFIADAFDRHAFGKQADARQIHRMTGIQRRLQAGRIFRFHRYHFNLRHQLLDQHRHACRQAAAAHRDEHAVDVGILLQQLQRQGPLTGDDHRVIERRHPGKALLLRQLNRSRLRFVKIGAMQQHFAAKAANGIHFDVGGRYRHHDQRLNAQPRCGERHALGMIARRGGDHPVGFLFRGQAGHHRVGAAQLKAVYRLAIFALHQNNVIQARREFVHFLQRRFLHRFINRRAQHCSQVFGALGGAGEGL